MKKILSPAKRLAELVEQAAEALPQDGSLREISELVERAQTLASGVILAELALDAKKYELREITDDLLPCAMQEVGIDEFTTTSGKKIRLQTIYGGTVSQGKNESDEDHTKRRAEAFMWLSRHKHDGIIKSHVSLSLARGEAPLARRIVMDVID